MTTWVPSTTSSALDLRAHVLTYTILYDDLNTVEVESLKMVNMVCGHEGASVALP